MRKAQDIYWWECSEVYIENKIPLPSLALTIFHQGYYDPVFLSISHWKTPFFVVVIMYGGHADVYMPSGENLYYYDVNSFYPFLMKTFPMPGGQPQWHENSHGQDLSSLYEFVSAS